MKEIILILVFACLYKQSPWAQRGRFDGQREAALSQPFKGSYYLDVPLENSYPLRETGVSTEPVRQAAKAFLASLSKEDLKKTVFPADDIEWRKWDNRHRYARQGISFNKMSKGQKSWLLIY